MRVYELARQMNVDRHVLLETLQNLEGFETIDNVMSRLTASDMEMIGLLFGIDRQSSVLSDGELRDRAIETLRGVFAQGQTLEVFEQVVSIVRDAQNDEVFEYAYGLLKQWSGELRRPIPGAWLGTWPEDHNRLMLLYNDLNLDGHTLEDEALLSEAALEVFLHMSHLSFSAHGLNAQVLAHILKAMPMDQLRTLDLSHCRLSTRSLEVLASSTKLRQVKALRLSGQGNIDSRSLFELLNSPNLCSVTHLDLTETQVAWDELRRHISQHDAQGMRLETFQCDGHVEHVMEILNWMRRDKEVVSNVWALGERVQNDPTAELNWEIGHGEPSAWSLTRQREVGQLLRDAYFLLRASPFGDAIARLEALADVLPCVEPVRCDGLMVSWHPSQTHHQLRFLRREDLPGDVRGRFYALDGKLTGFVGVFVDPIALSYRTFENILPMDGYFDGAPMDITCTPLEHPSAGIWQGMLQMNAQLKEALLGLDTLGVYVEPFNASSRGGKRFIFHSASLGRALTEAFSAQTVLGGGFHHVNPVFRCNRFEPNDAPFEHHVDTPYYDRSRGHISCYTMLLYLTEGEGEETLSFESYSFDRLDALQCVIFEQSMPHKGAAYASGRKLFLRTELIYEVDDAALTHEPALGALFAKACYMTGESLLHPELSSYMHACYDRVASAHWLGLTQQEDEAPYVLKQYQGIDFVSNGYDFWCAADHLTLKEAAALAVLDLLNCEVDGSAFRRLCVSEVLKGRTQEASTWMSEVFEASTRRGGPFGGATREVLMEDYRADGVSGCCPFHCPWGSPGSGWYEDEEEEEIVEFDPRSNSDVIWAWKDARDVVWRWLSKSAVWMLGQRIQLDERSIVVQGDKIHIMGCDAVDPLNFAACWNSEEQPEDFIGVEMTVDLPFRLLPPIQYRQINGCYHLMLDFFANDWMVDARPLNAPFPSVEGDVTDAWREALAPYIDEYELYDYEMY